MSERGAGMQEAKKADVAPTVGSIWIDRDRRMLSGNRRVVVESLDDQGNVFYRSASAYGQTDRARYRSKWRRFVKAFRPIQ